MTKIKLAYWNANGLQSNLEKKINILEAIEKEDLDIVFVSETHLRMGNQEDLSVFNGLNIITRERMQMDKGGGGLMAIVKPTLNFLEWEPQEQQFPEIAKEKLWILIHEGIDKIAVCAVYLAAQVPGTADFVDWNTKLYSVLQIEMRVLMEKGYKCLLVGDFNGHIGNGLDGIEGNKGEVNTNGRLLKAFISNNSMNLINADKSITTGTFTRSAGGCSTILDYALTSRGHIGLVEAMLIDENGSILTDSDHAALIIDLNVAKNEDLTWITSNKETMDIPANADYSLYHANLDRILEDRYDECKSIKETCTVLQQVVVQAGVDTFGMRTVSGKVGKKPPISKIIRKLRKERNILAGLVKRGTVWKTKYSLTGRVWAETDKKRLEGNTSKLASVNIRLKEESLKQKLKSRNKIRATTKIGSKKFWSLINRIVKKSSEIIAIEDEDGNIITNRDQLADIVLTDLSKIFKGQKSKIFVHKGQQLIKATRVKYQENHEQWIPDNVPPDAHEKEICRPATTSEIKRLINRNKDSRASGVDNIPTILFKNASEKYYELLTTMVNRCLKEGETPEQLNVGKMTLIDKKEPSLRVDKKRPLTVSSQIQSVITRLLADRMDKVCERNNLYGSTQFGFRSGKSTTDCVFLLLAALRKARKKRYQISIAFCDLQKAYDSVDREILYKKLSSVGFGGQVVSLIQSMYYNDSIRVKLGDGLSEQLWFTRGVKQGCCLSPLLFALYVSGLGVNLQDTGLGIQLGSVILTGIFFADDLVLISKTSFRGMNRLLGTVNAFCKDMRMTLSVSKTFVLTTGPRARTWKIGDSGETLQETLVAKYLGVNIQLRGRHTLKREQDIISTARRYAFSILSITRAGLDRSLVARSLWEMCAIPAILYGSEAMCLGDGTMNEIEKIQKIIGKFIIQVPNSTAGPAVWLDGGLMPIRYRIMKRKVNYLWRIVNKFRDPLLLECIKELFGDGGMDPWAKGMLDIEREIGVSIINTPLKVLNRAVLHAASLSVLEAKRGFNSLDVMPQPKLWFKHQPQINDSWQSRVLNLTRSGNLRLGNRMANRLGFQGKECPWCLNEGSRVRLSETHVILSCSAVRSVRAREKVQDYRQAKLGQGIRSWYQILRQYVGQDGADTRELQKRGAAIHCIVEAWLLKTERL